MIVRVDPRALSPTALRPPISKSDALRALAVAWLCELPPPPLGPVAELPEDVSRFLEGLRAIRSGGNAEIDCGDGGAPFRFLMAIAAAGRTCEDSPSTSEGHSSQVAGLTLTGSPRLGARPRDALIDALREGLGCSITTGDPWPVRLAPPPRLPESKRITIRAHQSSQFASAALFAAAAASRRDRAPWSVELLGPVASAGYLDLTVRWLRAGGIEVSHSPDKLQIDATQPPPAALPDIPRDWSSAAYLLLIGWRLHLPVHDLTWTAPHPDRAIVEHLERAKTNPDSGLDADVSAAPDLAPTLAALACVLAAPSTLRRVRILRDKESDRIDGIRALLTEFGARCEHDDRADALTITPPHRLPAHATFDARGDHRLALTATTLSILTGVPLTLSGAEVVRKSFPGFFAQLGVTLPASPSSASPAAATPR